MFGLALIADVVGCVPKVVGFILGWGVDGKDIDGSEVRECEGEMERVLVVIGG